eukprot:TRINITY_DN270_c0_g1_i1.p1 TRINITY_DN270_c0_g1~~TRINITY_DN270_c0_g1_i1.p1  ORF type:complete len:363 (-),score=61.22 TRINITY_DN270_c0_g1_i1:459-1547(-)
MSIMQKVQKLQPNLDQQSTKELNFTVLSRIDGDVEEILTTAGHVTLYEFDVDEKQWDRKDVEGSLFVVKRRSQPRFQFIVMNRRSTENLVENLLGDFEYEVQVPYLLYRNENQEVNGIWFYNPRECEEVASLFTRILSAFCKTPPKPKLFQPQGPDFQELEPPVLTSANMEGPLEPSTSGISQGVDVVDESLDHYFHQSAATLNVPDSAAVSRPSTGQTFVPSRSASIPSISSLLPQPSLSSTPLPQAGSPPLHASVSGDFADVGGATLIKPDFFAQNSTVQIIAPQILPSATGSAPSQPSHGARLLQPFPPPTPPPSLTPANTLPHVAITRDRVRDALYRLLQDDRFIDIVYEEMLMAHST